jgi:hypothetical protein
MRIINAPSVTIDQGDEVIVPTTFWVSYTDLVLGPIVHLSPLRAVKRVISGLPSALEAALRLSHDDLFSTRPPIRPVQLTPQGSCGYGLKS